MLGSPPTGHSGNVYAVLGAQNDGSGGWYISLGNVSGIAAPYTDWDIMTNGKWMGSVDCSGTEPSWTCNYYVPSPPYGSEATGLVFPWRSGTWAEYGMAGIHDTPSSNPSSMLPGSSAVDFVSGDTYGSSAMPPYAYAVAAGTVVSNCVGRINEGIRVDGPSGDFLYWHLIPGQPNLAVGTTLQQGQEIGVLRYGTFNDAPCGWASQSSTEYHIHFAFIPSGGYFQIGGCILDMSTQNWVCGTNTVGVLGHLMNGSIPGPAPTSSSPTQTPGGPTATPGPPGPPPGQPVGGEHVWNGLISGIISFINSNAKTILPAHTPSSTISDAINNIWSTILDFGWMIQSLQMIWVLPALILYGVMLLIEIVRWIYVGYRFIIGLEPVK